MAKEAWHDINDLSYLPSAIREKYRKQKEEEERKAAKEQQAWDDFCEREAYKASLKPEFYDESWRHNDEKRAQESPDEAFEGDEVLLQVKCKDMVDGASARITIRDTTKEPWKDVITLKGRIEGQILCIPWTVELPPSDTQKSTYGFEAFYSGFSGNKYSKTVPLPVGRKITCDFVEIPDINFHHNSALPCLDNKGGLIDALGAAFVFVKENPSKVTVVFGHSDTSGDPSYNYDISQWRAESVKALLDNDSETWLDMVELASKAEDIQQLLSSLVTGYGWSCDPGTVDNRMGPKTKAGLKTFQEEYNAKYDGTLRVDGIIGEKTWTALFCTLRSFLEETVEAKTGENSIPQLTYGYEGNGIYPCGESFPVDETARDDYKSAENRRVEILFFDKGTCPKLKKPVRKQKVEKREAPVYDERRYEKKIITTSAMEPADASDKLVFYHAERDEYLEVTGNEGFQFFSNETDRIDSLANDIGAVWKQGDFEQQCKKAEAAGKKLETLLGSKRQVSPKDAFDELVLCRRDKNKRWGKSVVYVRKKRLRDRIKSGKGVKGFKRAGYDEAKELSEFMETETAESAVSPNPLQSVKATFWKAQGADSSKWKFTARDKDGNTDVLADNEHFSLSAEAQFLRFAAGASVTSDVTSLLQGKPKFSVGIQGSVTFALAEGTVSGAYHFPNKTGYNLLRLFTSSKKLTGLVKEGRTCSVLFKATLEGYGFVGASANAIISLPNIDFSKAGEKTSKSDTAYGSTTPQKGGRNKDAYVGGEAGFAATASVGGSLAVSMEWKGHNTPKFEALGEIKGCGEASAGIAIQLVAQAGLMDGEFRVKFGAQAVAGLGIKLGTEIGLGIDQGYKFVTYILYSLDYHYAMEIAGDAFKAVARMSIAKITEVSEVADDLSVWGKDIVIDAFNWGERMGRKVKQEMVQAIISGQKNQEVEMTLPESGGFLILGIMETPEEQDFDAIIAILRPASQHKLKSVLRTVSEMKLDRNDPDFSAQQGKALQEGIRRLLEFGGYFEKQGNRKNRKYLKTLLKILKNAEVKHNYEEEI